MRGIDGDVGGAAQDVRAVRIGLLGGVAAAGIAAAMLFPPSAFAQANDACAAPTNGTVTCTPGGNPYPQWHPLSDAGGQRAARPAGPLQDGVAVQLAPAAVGNGAIELTSTGGGNLTLTGGTSTSAAGGGAVRYGVYARQASGNVALTIGSAQTTVASAGAAIGVRKTGGGAVTISTGSTSSTGNSSNAIYVRSDVGTAAVTSGTASTSGANARAILIQTSGGARLATMGLTQTTGVRSNAITVTDQAGPITIDASGGARVAGAESIGVFAQSTNAVSLTLGEVTKTGAYSSGVYARGGTVTVNANGSITTSGGRKMRCASRAATPRWR